MNSLYHIQLPVFEGPLDLLLQLIEREEFDITTIALARVTDQYLDQLAEMEKRQVKDLADFLIVAAKLLLIKSATLLPRPSQPQPEADLQDAGDDLVHQLQIYKRFKEIAARLHEREEAGLHSYVRLAPLPRHDPQPDLEDITLHKLLDLAREALKVKTGPPVGEVVTPVTVTIAERITHIEQELDRRSRIRFHDLFTSNATRTEVIVTLLALLELIKQNQAQVWQKSLFGDIFIQRRSSRIENAEAT
jgi:segregation and condensation protein A